MLEFGRDLDNESHAYFAYQSRVLSDIHERFGAVRESIPIAHEADPWEPSIIYALTNQAHTGGSHPLKGVFFVTGTPIPRAIPQTLGRDP